MKITQNDPLLTAYVLNEIEDAETIKAIEEAIEQDEAIAEEVSKIKEFSLFLDQELKDEKLELSEEDKDNILRNIPADTEPEENKIIRKWPAQLIGWPMGIAASIAFIAMITLNMQQEIPSYDESAPSVTQERDSLGAGIKAEQEKPGSMVGQIMGRSDSTMEAAADVPDIAIAYQKMEDEYKEILETRAITEQDHNDVRNKVEAQTGIKLPQPAPPMEEASVPINLMPSNKSKPQVRRKLMVKQASKGKARLTGTGSIPLSPAVVHTASSSQALVLSSGLSSTQLQSMNDLDDLNRLGIDSFAPESMNTESYDSVEENDFVQVLDDPLSTFSIDVDTASYTNVRRMIKQGMLPPPGAVRIEEMINYFPYQYNKPEEEAKHPFNIHTEVGSAYWNPKHKVVRIGIQGEDIDWKNKPDSNLVFLLDVSGSMDSPQKLPLVKKALKLLVEQMGPNDRVAIVVYAGASGLVLPSTTANNHETIMHAIENLDSGGSTNGGAGIQLAYKIAKKHWIEGGNNRVILCTDGDFNVGVSDRSKLVELIQEKAKEKIFLSILGFGSGNYKDATMEELSNKGNGNYAYIDSMQEARKVLVEQAGGTLFTIAKDVKIQVEFNPSTVSQYRLIGYENRTMAAQDFNNDKKDAGEIGAGHSVTALYEIIPANIEDPSKDIDPLKYQTAPQKVISEKLDQELLTVKFRYKQPDADTSTLISHPVINQKSQFKDTSNDFQFASYVATWASMLRNSKHIGDMDSKEFQSDISKSMDKDPHGYRKEFLELVERYFQIKKE